MWSSHRELADPAASWNGETNLQHFYYVHDCTCTCVHLDAYEYSMRITASHVYTCTCTYTQVGCSMTKYHVIRMECHVTCRVEPRLVVLVGAVPIRIWCKTDTHNLVTMAMLLSTYHHDDHPLPNRPSNNEYNHNFESRKTCFTCFITSFVA